VDSVEISQCDDRVPEGSFQIFNSFDDVHDKLCPASALRCGNENILRVKPSKLLSSIERKEGVDFIPENIK